MLPESAGLLQAIGQPEVGVCRRVAIEYLPLALGGAPPEPGRQVPLQVALGQVVFQPAQQTFEGLPIAGCQGEEQGIGLAFRGGDRAWVAAVDHPAAGIDEALLELLPQWPLAAGVRGVAERRKD
ncbi:hypothetical protein FQZ97_1011990 [compost metagenome]